MGARTLRRARASRRNGLGTLFGTLLALAGAAEAGAISVEFDDSSALVMQGLLQQGPNTTCEGSGGTAEFFPSPFVFNNNDPGEDHLYQAYTFYNNGPERCIDVNLTWIQQDCGDLGIGASIYLDSFNPADPTENFLGHTFEIERDFFVVGVDPWHRNDFRHSYGFYRDEVQNYHLDHMTAYALAPALSRIIVVLDSLDQPGNTRTCPVNPATASLWLTSPELSDDPLGISVNDSSNYEFNPPPGIATVDFYVSLSAQFTEPFSIDYQTTGGTAASGVDFAPTSGTLTFDPGQTFKLVQVPILSDTDFPETNGISETFTLTLSNPNPPGVPITDGTAVGTIWEDDDPAGVCRITNHPEGPLPPGKVGQPYGPVDFDPAGGEVAGDYLWQVSGLATPPPGINFSVFTQNPGDLQFHGRLDGTPTQSGDYTFDIELGCPLSKGGYEYVTYEYSIHIEPEDPEVILTLTGAAELEGDAGFTPVLPQIELSGPLAYDLYLEVRLYDSSATLANDDYDALPPAQQILIPANTLVEPIPLDIVGDLDVEPNEEFIVELRTVIEQNVVATAFVGILNDDEDPTVLEIPTLGDLGLGALALVLGGAAVRSIRRRRRK